MGKSNKLKNIPQPLKIKISRSLSNMLCYLISYLISVKKLKKFEVKLFFVQMKKLLKNQKTKHLQIGFTAEECFNELQEMKIKGSTILQLVRNNQKMLKFIELLYLVRNQNKITSFSKIKLFDSLMILDSFSPLLNFVPSINVDYFKTIVSTTSLFFLTFIR